MAHNLHRSTLQLPDKFSFIAPFPTHHPLFSSRMQPTLVKKNYLKWWEIWLLTWYIGWPDVIIHISKEKEALDVTLHN